MNLKFEAPSFFQFAIIMSCVKLLLLNSYHSTDFEVHRNWLAITYTLPISEWYFEETSEWTLDYPPFFAWFEYALSQIAVYFDDKMLDLDNLGYNSARTVLFQRLSVIVMDLVLLYALHKFYNQLFQGKKEDNTKMFLLVSIFANSGLLLVDHIHFQYNGFLFSFLLLSITDMLQDKFLPSAFWFTVLLNFKHIFLYVAPCYFVYLLRNYCFRRPIQKGWFTMFGVDILQLSISNLLKLAFVVVGVFLISFGPFIYLEQIPQVASRLFPVKRGLCHAYWAANFWAVYATADKVLTIAGPKMGLALANQDEVASMTGGLVAQQNFSVLPNVPALVTGVVTILFLLPALLKVWYRPYSAKTFLPCLTLCAYASFLFGYHVHEKAIMIVVIPLALLALLSSKYARVYIVLSITGHYALFPLLYQPAETTLKILILLLPTLVTLALLKRIHKEENDFLAIPFVTWYESLYLYGLIPLYFYTEFGHHLLGFQERLPFIPLMMTSFYCSVGVIWSWVLLYFDFLLEVDDDEVQKRKDNSSSSSSRKTKKKIQ